MRHWLTGGLVLSALFFASIGSPASNVQAPSQDETTALLKAGRFAELEADYSGLQAAYRSGAISDEELRVAFRAFYTTDESLVAKYDAWVERYPKSYAANLARGIYFKRLALDRHGDETVDRSKVSQLRGMRRAFDEAEKSLDASVALDPKPILSYLHSMDITRSRSDRRGSRQLFERSLEVDPRNLVVREKYMDSLRPRWGGSLKEMNDFLLHSKVAGLSPAGLDALKTIGVDERAYHFQFDDKDYPAAIKAYREAQSLGGTYCEPCFAQALTANKEYEAALKMYDVLIARAPRDAESLGRRGNVYVLLEKHAAGIADFRAAAGMGDAYAQSQLGYFYMHGIPGVLDPDPRTGLDWLRKSAAQGHPLGREYLSQAETR